MQNDGVALLNDGVVMQNDGAAEKHGVAM